MKNKKPIIIVVVIVAVIALFVLLFSRNDIFGEKDEVKIYDNKMDEFIITSSASETGAFYSADVSLSTDGNTAVLEIVHKEAEKYPDKKENYTVSADIFTALEQIFYDNNVGKWASRKDAELNAYDAAIYELRFKFGDELLFIPQTKIDEDGLEVVNAFLDVIDEYSKNENSNAKLSESSLTAESETDCIALYNIKNGYLKCGIRNGKDFDAKYRTDFKLFIKNGDNYTEITPSEKIKSHYFTVPAGGEVPIQFDLNLFGILTPGQYQIKCSDLTAEFTVVL